MSKCFDVFPPELEKYNPENFLSNSNNTELESSFDEDGLYHTDNDAPSKIKIFGDENDYYSLGWHSHGTPYRENNEPYSLMFLGNMYRTYDTKGEFHSFNDMPSFIDVDEKEGLITMIWHSHGRPNRENDLPAYAIWKFSKNKRKFSVIQEMYYLDGEGHRGNSMPSVNRVNTLMWSVRDVLHNANGYAVSHVPNIKERLLGREGEKIWSLFGILMTEEQFNQVKALEISKEIPLWAAVLYFFKFIDENHLTAMKDGSVLPILWWLRAWGLVDQTFTAKLSILTNEQDIKYEINIEQFIKVAKFEEAELLKDKTEGNTYV